MFFFNELNAFCLMCLIPFDISIFQDARNNLPLDLIPCVLKIPLFGEFSSNFFLNNAFVLVLKIIYFQQY